VFQYIGDEGRQPRQIVIVIGLPELGFLAVLLGDLEQLLMRVREAGQNGGDILLILQNALFQQGVGVFRPDFLRKRLGVLTEQPRHFANRLTVRRLAVLGVGLGQRGQRLHLQVIGGGARQWLAVGTEIFHLFANGGQEIGLALLQLNLAFDDPIARQSGEFAVLMEAGQKPIAFLLIEIEVGEAGSRLVIAGRRRLARRHRRARRRRPRPRLTLFRRLLPLQLHQPNQHFLLVVLIPFFQRQRPNSRKQT